MELRELQKHPVKRRVRPVQGGFEVCEEGGFELEWDANKFTSEVGRRMARVAREQAEKADAAQAARAKPAEGEQGDAKAKSFAAVAEASAARMELTAEIEDLNKLMYADALASDRHGLLTSWSVTKDGKATEPTYEYLLTFNEETLVGLFQFCREESGPKKPAAGTEPSTGSPTTASPTSDSSSTETTPTATDPNTSEQ